MFIVFITCILEQAINEQVLHLNIYSAKAALNVFETNMRYLALTPYNTRPITSPAIVFNNYMENNVINNVTKVWTCQQVLAV